MAAAIVALAGPVPAHIGTDSQAFLTQAQRVQQRLLDGKPQPRPWGTLRDGDLWQQYQQCLQAKGPTSVRLTKVKGHATREDVARGRSTAMHKFGNDTADLAADKAVQLHGTDLIDLGALWTQRHRQYIALLVAGQDCHSGATN